MKYISTTDLRTKSTELIQSLKMGDSINLIHRSEVVGVIAPAVSAQEKSSFKALKLFLNLAKPASLDNQEDAYREYMETRHG